MDKVQKEGFYGNLDTIRCISVFFVIVYHWLPDKVSFFPFAKVGVDFFFVISGFLITEILLKSKQRILDHISSKRHALAVFYAKRTLRIFPIYFMLLTIMLLCKIPPLGSDWIYLFTYTTNFFIYFKKQWIYPLSHLWSLAVEEQFYIFWPFLVLFTKTKWHLGLILIIILSSFLFIWVYSSKNEFFFLLPFTCMSTLCFGALIAYVKNEMKHSFLKIVPWSLPLFLISSLVFCVFYTSFNFIAEHFLIAVSGVSLLVHSITTKNYWYNRIFSNPVTSYFGRISYGLYLYHHPIPLFVRILTDKLGRLTGKSQGALAFFYNERVILFESLLLLLVGSFVSWYLIEKPINSLKARFS